MADKKLEINVNNDDNRVEGITDIKVSLDDDGISIRHKEFVNENGEVVRFAPIEIYNKADLDNYGITWDDCKTLRFGSSYRKTVYYFPTTNEKLADDLWVEMNSSHSRSYRRNRCHVPGKRKAFIICPDTNKCSACPYGRKPEDRKANIVSWELMAETGYEMQADDRELRARLAWMEFEKIKVFMDRKDTNIAKAIIMKEMDGFSVTKIAEELRITERQVYYCLQQAKDIGKMYKKKYNQE